jgi:hypothetical protein
MASHSTVGLSGIQNVNAILHDAALQNFMDGNPAAVDIINKFMAARDDATTTPATDHNQHRQQHKAGIMSAGNAAAAQTSRPPASYSASLAAPAQPSPAAVAASTRQDKDKWLSLGGSLQAAADTAAAVPAANDGSSSSSHNPQVGGRQQAAGTSAVGAVYCAAGDLQLPAVAVPPTQHILPTLGGRMGHGPFCTLTVM